MPILAAANKHLIKSWFLHASQHPCVKNKWFSLSAWIEIIKMEIENTADTNKNNELADILLNVSDLKQSLKDIVHYHNYETANPEGPYIFEDRPKLIVNGKVSRQRRFAILSSKEKTKLPPMIG